MMAPFYLSCAIGCAIGWWLLDRWLERKHREWMLRNAPNLSTCMRCGQFIEHGHHERCEASHG